MARKSTADRLENATITETVSVTSPLSGFSVGSMQEDYVLNEAEFMRLTNDWNSFKAWALNLLFVMLGYTLSLVPSFFPRGGLPPVPISDGERFVLFTGYGVVVLFYLIGLSIPNEKKKLIKKMHLHFKNAPRSRHVLKGGQ